MSKYVPKGDRRTKEQMAACRWLAAATPEEWADALEVTGFSEATLQQCARNGGGAECLVKVVMAYRWRVEMAYRRKFEAARKAQEEKGTL